MRIGVRVVGDERSPKAARDPQAERPGARALEDRPRPHSGVLDSPSHRAYDLISSWGLLSAFDLFRDGLRLQSHFRTHPRGQSALQARGLAEAVVPLLTEFRPDDGRPDVSVYWDNHDRDLSGLKTRLMLAADEASWRSRTTSRPEAGRAGRWPSPWAAPSREARGQAGMGGPAGQHGDGARPGPWNYGADRTSPAPEQRNAGIEFLIWSRLTLLIARKHEVSHVAIA